MTEHNSAICEVFPDPNLSTLPAGGLFDMMATEQLTRLSLQELHIRQEYGDFSFQCQANTIHITPTSDSAELLAREPAAQHVKGGARRPSYSALPSPTDAADDALEPLVPCPGNIFRHHSTADALSDDDILKDQALDEERCRWLLLQLEHAKRYSGNNMDLWAAVVIQRCWRRWVSRHHDVRAASAEQALQEQRLLLMRMLLQQARDTLLAAQAQAQYQRTRDRLMWQQCRGANPLLNSVPVAPSCISTELWNRASAMGLDPIGILEGAGMRPIHIQMVLETSGISVPGITDGAAKAARPPTGSPRARRVSESSSPSGAAATAATMAPPLPRKCPVPPVVPRTARPSDAGSGADSAATSPLGDGAVMVPSALRSPASPHSPTKAAAAERFTRRASGSNEQVSTAAPGGSADSLAFGGGVPRSPTRGGVTPAAHSGHHSGGARRGSDSDERTSPTARYAVTPITFSPTGLSAPLSKQASAYGLASQSSGSYERPVPSLRPTPTPSGPAKASPSHLPSGLSVIASLNQDSGRAGGMSGVPLKNGSSGAIGPFVPSGARPLYPTKLSLPPRPLPPVSRPGPLTPCSTSAQQELSGSDPFRAVQMKAPNMGIINVGLPSGLGESLISAFSETHLSGGGSGGRSPGHGGSLSSSRPGTPKRGNPLALGRATTSTPEWLLAEASGALKAAAAGLPSSPAAPQRFQRKVSPSSSPGISSSENVIAGLAAAPSKLSCGSADVKPSDLTGSRFPAVMPRYIPTATTASD